MEQTIDKANGEKNEKGFPVKGVTRVSPFGKALPLLAFEGVAILLVFGPSVPIQGE